jgi:hypothetical protein
VYSLPIIPFLFVFSGARAAPDLGSHLARHATWCSSAAPLKNKKNRNAQWSPYYTQAIPSGIWRGRALE